MHVASLELCKELYELSGWLDRLEPNDDGLEPIPEYTLGFLLRSLPQAIDNAPLTLCTDGTGMHEDVSWCAYFDGSPVVWQAYHLDTPEDAAAKLAIELFKQGVLKK